MKEVEDAQLAEVQGGVEPGDPTDASSEPAPIPHRGELSEDPVLGRQPLIEP